MNKRLISLLLTIIMLFSVMLTSCSSTSDEDAVDDVNAEASRYTTTLSMYLITEKETTPEAAAAVAEAFNKITKSKFKTQVNMYFYTEDELYQVIDEKVAAIEAEIEAEEAARKAAKEEAKRLKALGITAAATTAPETDDETTAEETVIDEWGLSQLKYPEESSRQIDIIAFTGYERYLDYIDRDILSRLDDELSSGSKKLKDYINPVFMDAAAVDGSTYAIPNNHLIGEYTYLLVNKELAAKYSYDPTDFTELSFAADFVEDVAKYEKDVTPVCGELELTNIKYMSLDKNTLKFTNEPSVVGAFVSATAGYSTRISFRQIFATRQITDQIKVIQEFADKGYIKKDADPSKPFAISVMKGTRDLVNQYGDEYEMIVLENPMATEETLYSGMFGVSSYTKDLTRSMEIVTYINTNAELRNLLQYGIEGVNYQINEDGTLTRLNREYMMDLNKTGNAFVAYPEEGMPADAWESGKLQNIDARLDPMHGFTFVDNGLDWKWVEIIEAASDKYLPQLNACKTAEEVTAFVDKSYEELLADTDFANANKTLTEGTPNYVYNEWYNTNWPPEG